MARGLARNGAEIDGQAEGRGQKCFMRALLVLLSLIWACAASAREVRLCVDGNDWAPYTYPDHDGTLQKRLRQVAAQQGDRVTFRALPWLRCLSMVESGELDGVLALPGVPAKAEHFALPMIDGHIDDSRAAGIGVLVLLRRADSGVTWDGSHLTGLQGKVGYVMGYDGIAARLDELGIPSSGEYHSAGQDMMALLAGRTNVMATYAQDAAVLLAMPAYRGKLVLLDPPLGHVSYFLGFNKEFQARERERTEALWSGLARAREAD